MSSLWNCFGLLDLAKWFSFSHKNIRVFTKLHSSGMENLITPEALDTTRTTQTSVVFLGADYHIFPVMSKRFSEAGIRTGASPSGGTGLVMVHLYFLECHCCSSFSCVGLLYQRLRDERTLKDSWHRTYQVEWQYWA
jgi:hypothetical protein